MEDLMASHVTKGLQMEVRCDLCFPVVTFEELQLM